MCNERVRESDTVQVWIFDDIILCSLDFFFLSRRAAARRAPPLKIVLWCNAQCPKGFVGAEKTFGLYVAVVVVLQQNGFYGRPQTVLNKNLLKDRTVWLIAPSGGASLPLARPFQRGRGHGYQTAAAAGSQSNYSLLLIH